MLRHYLPSPTYILRSTFSAYSSLFVRAPPVYSSTALHHFRPTYIIPQNAFQFSIFNCKQPNSPSFSEHPSPAQSIAYITHHPIIRHEVSLNKKASNLPIPFHFDQLRSICSYTHSSVSCTIAPLCGLYLMSSPSCFSCGHSMLLTIH